MNRNEIGVMKNAINNYELIEFYSSYKVATEYTANYVVASFNFTVRHKIHKDLIIHVLYYNPEFLDKNNIKSIYTSGNNNINYKLFNPQMKSWNVFRDVIISKLDVDHLTNFYYEYAKKIAKKYHKSITDKSVINAMKNNVLDPYVINCCLDPICHEIEKCCLIDVN